MRSLRDASGVLRTFVLRSGRKAKISYKIELVEKRNRRVAVLSSGQWLWAKGGIGLHRRAPEAPVSCQPNEETYMQQNPEKGLAHQLNVHGYGFQYAVLKTSKKCFDDHNSPWVFEVSEFPVEINGVSTHIDFILRNTKEPFYLVAECKRADPALSNWCFVKAPFVSRMASGRERIVREVLVSRKASGDPPTERIDWIMRSDEIYRLAFEVKSGQKGDGKFGRGNINDAITQVLRGQNGLFNYFASKLEKTKTMPLGGSFGESKYAAFLPVIFTTAKLWVSDIDLSEADINTGKIDLPAESLVEREWLLFHYSQTPDISHALSGFSKIDELSDALYFDYTRTIPIVNAAGIQSFLSDSLWMHPEDWQSN